MPEREVILPFNKLPVVGPSIDVKEECPTTYTGDTNTQIEN